MRSAPVKAPFSCPNSSLSSSVGERAAQFTHSSGMCARGEAAWMARASSSLPVPLSPVISTVAWLCATRSTFSSTGRIAADSPISRISGFRSSIVRRITSFSRRMFRSRTARSIRMATSSELKGF